MMAPGSKTAKLSASRSTMTGMRPLGFSARNSGVFCSLFMMSIGCTAYGICSSSSVHDNFNTNLRKGPEDYPVTGIALPRMVNAVGGSTIHFAGHWFRYRPADFRKGTEHGLEGTIDWPFTYEHLAPFYDINDAEVGIAGLRGDPSYPPRPERYGAPIKPGKGGRRMAQAWNRLGWQ